MTPEYTIYSLTDPDKPIRTTTIKDIALQESEDGHRVSARANAGDIRSIIPDALAPPPAPARRRPIFERRLSRRQRRRN